MALTINEAVRVCGVKKSTLHHWINRGWVEVVMRDPIMVERAQVERARDRWRPGDTYRLVMERRGCSYVAARMWVGRQRDKGLGLTEILEKVGA